MVLTLEFNSIGVWSYGNGSATRGIFTAGSYLPSYAYRNTIDIVTIASTGNAQDSGFDLLTTGAGKSCSNSTVLYSKLQQEIIDK